MKLFTITLLVACIVLADCNSEEITSKIQQHRKECIAESGVDEEIVKKAREGIYEDDSKFKTFLVCVMKKPGFINDKGEYQVDIIKAKMTDKYDEATADKYIKECIKENQQLTEENALEMGKCFYEHVIKGKH